MYLYEHLNSFRVYIQILCRVCIYIYIHIYIYTHVYVHVVPNNPSIGPMLFRYNSRTVDGDGPLPKLRYIVHAYMLKTSLRHLNGCFFPGNHHQFALFQVGKIS